MNERSESRPGRAQRVRLSQLGVMAAALALGACGGGVQSPPLHHAASLGDEAEVARLLAEGTNVDERDEGGRTPLMAAAEAHETPTVRLLLQHGADIDARANDGQSALGLAVGAKERETEAAARAVKTGVHEAALATPFKGEENLEILRVLLSFGAKVEDAVLDAAERPDRVESFLFLTMAAAGGRKPDLGRAEFLTKKLHAAGVWDATYRPEDRTKMAARIDRIGIDPGFAHQVFTTLDGYLARFLGRTVREANLLEPPASGTGTAQEAGLVALTVAANLLGSSNYSVPANRMNKTQVAFRLGYLELWEEVLFVREVVLRQAALGAATLRAQSKNASQAVLVDPGWVEASMAVRLASFYELWHRTCGLVETQGARYVFEKEEKDVLREQCGWREASDDASAKPAQSSKGAK